MVGKLVYAQSRIARPAPARTIGEQLTGLQLSGDVDLQLPEDVQT